VEYALTMPLLLLLLAGCLNYSAALRMAGSVAVAARAGAAYGAGKPGNAADASGIEAAARNAAPDVSISKVTSSLTCQCPDGIAVSCSGTCTGNLQAYVQVTVHATSSSIFSYPNLGFSGQTTGQAKVRIQ
jgi:Flp pilus assembly protein TadG